MADAQAFVAAIDLVAAAVEGDTAASGETIGRVMAGPVGAMHLVAGLVNVCQVLLANIEEMRGTESDGTLPLLAVMRQAILDADVSRKV